MHYSIELQFGVLSDKLEMQMSDGFRLQSNRKIRNEQFSPTPPFNSMICLDIIEGFRIREANIESFN
jgi:hypothetical protein